MTTTLQTSAPKAISVGDRVMVELVHNEFSAGEVIDIKTDISNGKRTAYVDMNGDGSYVVASLVNDLRRAA
jgi:hypothetical protein